MALNPSSEFVAKNNEAYKTPMYLASFQTVYGYARKFRIKTVVNPFPLVIELEEYRYNSVSEQYEWLTPDPPFTIDEWAGYTAVFISDSGYETTGVIANNDSDTLYFDVSLDMGIIGVGVQIRIDKYESFCTYMPVQTPNSVEPKPYISFISGGGYSITPDEGSTSSSTLKVELQDHNDEVTAMIHNATGRLQKKTCIVKAGYVGMTEDKMLTVFTGEVTDYQRNDDGSWEFSVSDAIRRLNKNIFRNAGEGADTITVTGNPIDLLLSICISKDGDGTKGPYDNLETGIGLDMAVSQLDVEGFENIRDNYYPGTAVIFNFDMTDRISANEFFQDELFKPLNMYPIVLGDGRFSARIYRPVVPPFTPVELDENDMVGIPTYDGNLTDLINEVQFSYNHDGDDFQTIVTYADAISINERSVGDRTLEIEAMGIKSAYMDADDFLIRSANRIFNRYATPPIKLNVTTYFKNMLIESGDIITVSNRFLPNLDSGAYDFSEIPMEVIKRTVDWKRGVVKLELLQTGYDKDDYAAISPELISINGISMTQFSVTEIKDYEVGFVISVYRRILDTTSGPGWYHLEKVADDITITNIVDNGSSYTVTTDSIGVNYDYDMRIVFNDDPPTLTEYQQRWGRIGAGYLISA